MIIAQAKSWASGLCIRWARPTRTRFATLARQGPIFGGYLWRLQI